MGASFFKLTMQLNAKAMMTKPFNMNPMMRMWYLINGSHYLCHESAKYIKLAEIAICMVTGSV
jgi:hypothetical protein